MNETTAKLTDEEARLQENIENAQRSAQIRSLAELYNTAGKLLRAALKSRDMAAVEARDKERAAIMRQVIRTRCALEFEGALSAMQHPEEPKTQEQTQ